MDFPRSPCWVIYLSRNFKTLSEVLVVVTIADGHLEKRSVATKTYFLLSFKYLIGPQKSNCIHSFGSPGSGTFPMSPLGNNVFKFLPYPHVCTADSTWPSLPNGGTCKGTINHALLQTCSFCRDGRNVS